MNGNDFMSWILRSPLHGMLSNSMMLITVTGHRTGRKFTTPVGYYRENGSLWVLTSRDRTWWKNLKGGAEVSLLLQHEPVTAFAEPEMEIHKVEARLVQYLRHIPQAAKQMGIRVDNGIPDRADLQKVSKDKLFVRIDPRSNEQ